MAIPCKIVEVEGEAKIIATGITAPVKVKTGETISGCATFKNVGDATGTHLCRVEAVYPGGVPSNVGEGTLTLGPTTEGFVDYSFVAGGKGTITICPYPNP